MSDKHQSNGPGSHLLDKALYVVGALVVLAFGALLVDLVRQQEWLDVALLLVGGVLVVACFILQRSTRPPTS